jgi:hypothetical protein
MARTKQHFGVVVTTITQWWSPTVIRVTGDRNVRDQIKRTPDGGLECRFPERLVLIANHQVLLNIFHAQARHTKFSFSCTPIGFICGG